LFFEKLSTKPHAAEKRKTNGGFGLGDQILVEELKTSFEENSIKI